jgi:hypothetical protein
MAKQVVDRIQRLPARLMDKQKEKNNACDDEYDKQEK